MMKTSFCFFTFLILSACSLKKDFSPQKQLPQIAFEVTQGIHRPKSVLYSHRHGVFFVSNMATDNFFETKSSGYVSKISADGKSVTTQWIKDLNAPKGMAIVGDHLYVADVKKILKIHIPSERIVKVFLMGQTKLLGDLTADVEGHVYATDMLDDKIYRIQNDKPTIWLSHPQIFGGNGLHTDGKEHLMVARWGTQVDKNSLIAKKSGDITFINLKNPSEILNLKGIQGHLDGISADGNGHLWISDRLSGDIYMMSKNAKISKMFNLGPGTADISVAKELNLLVVPQINQNKLIFIKIYND